MCGVIFFSVFGYGNEITLLHYWVLLSTMSLTYIYIDVVMLQFVYSLSTLIFSGG